MLLRVLIVLKACSSSAGSSRVTFTLSWGRFPGTNMLSTLFSRSRLRSEKLKVKLMFFDFKSSSSAHCLKLRISFISDKIHSKVCAVLLASSPGTGAVGDEESEKAPDQQTFHNLFGWNTFH